jgi:hypothetical protein
VNASVLPTIPAITMTVSSFQVCLTFCAIPLTSS